jgi:SNF2 family DNA or RNA helicase
MLDVTCRALNGEGVSAAVLHGSAAQRAEVVKRFISPAAGAGGLQVLLLNATADCSGLSLVVANHLFVLDPVMSPATLQQLCGRISRQGQTKPCAIYHVISSGSVDEGLVMIRSKRQGNVKEELSVNEVTKLLSQ